MERIAHLEVVLKITEVCNINCTYCYFFNKGSTQWQRHDAVIGDETVEAVIAFLEAGIAARGVETLSIDFHGGEPLLMKKPQFDRLCARLRAAFEGRVDLRLKMQTNGVAVDEGWIALFERHGVSVGVSIDGPAAVNDVERIDHMGRGTYERVAAGIRLLKAAEAEGRLPPVGLLCVVTPGADGGQIYRHFAEAFGVKGLSFLLPLDTIDELRDSGRTDDGAVGAFLKQAFDEFARDDDPSFAVRNFQNALVGLSAGPRAREAYDAAVAGHRAITISSNGDLGPDDTFRSGVPAFFADGCDVRGTTLDAFLSSAPFVALAAAADKPEGCKGCAWWNVCRGGPTVNRFASEGGFAHASAFCGSLSSYYSHVAAYLLRHGLPLEQLCASLDIEVPDHAAA